MKVLVASIVVAALGVGVILGWIFEDFWRRLK